MGGLGLGLGLGLSKLRRVAAAAGGSGPEILADTTFATSTGWTYTDGGGTSSLVIEDGVLKVNGGSANTTTYMEAETSGIAENDVIDIQVTVTDRNLGGAFFRLGGGTEVSLASDPGTYTVQVTCGASGTNLRIRGTQFTAGRFIYIDDLVPSYA